MAAEPPKPEIFNLYFRNGSTQLDGESLLMLSEILDSIRKRNSFDISVNGHSDRVGPASFNRRLSLQRAIRIRSLLIKAGVNPATISAASHGEGNPLIRTADNVAEPRNRRVEVIVR
jgi:outer membrane protein OmpA-like peptidoglycan-associated protein